MFLIKVVFSEVSAWKQEPNKTQVKMYEKVLKRGVGGAGVVLLTIPLELYASKWKVILHRQSAHLGRVLNGFLPLLYPSASKAAEAAQRQTYRHISRFSC